MDTVARAGELADKIAAEGIRAVTDARDVNPPCVLVVPVPGRERVNACGFNYTWRIWCLAPGPGNLDAAAKLEQLFAGVDAALTVDGADAQSYTVANQDLPAYLCTFTEVG